MLEVIEWTDPATKCGAEWRDLSCGSQTALGHTQHGIDANVGTAWWIGAR